jgi:hypothetical protein
MARLLLRPATLILIAANLVPIVGVILWGWDAFILLMLYWLETAVIAFWTTVRIATMPRDALGDIKFDGSDKPAAPLALAAFFTVHAGIFMGVHFVFLWTLFSGDWSQKIHGPRSFIELIVIDTGLWLPLAVLFVVRGALIMFDSIEPWLRRRFRIAPARADERGLLSPSETLLSGLYARIVVMQVTIIFGAWFALLIGTAGAYIFLIAIKTAIDVALQIGGNALHAAWLKAKTKAESAPP